MKKHKPIALLLAIFMAFALFGCGDDTTDKTDGGDNQSPTFAGANLTLMRSGKPDYSAHEGEQMLIGAWNSAPGNGINYEIPQAVLTTAKDAGIQFLCDVRAVKYTNKEKFRKTLDAIEQSGLKLIVNLSGTEYDKISDSGNGYSVLSEYMHKDFFMGFNFEDEPSIPEFTSRKLQESSAAFLQDHPGKTAYVNLLPNYANQGQLGITNGQTYKDYVHTYVDKVTSASVLSYDFYPLAGQMSNGMVAEHTLNNLWLGSLEVMANAAKSVNKDLWVFIQAMDFNNTNRAPQSKADITLQNYINMCYGARCLQYFSLTTPPDGNEHFGPALLDRDLNRTDNFTYVKAANEELQTFAHAYLQFTWDNVMPVEGTVISDVLTNGFDLLSTHMTKSDDFTVTSNMDTLVGQFHDADGYKGYMVARISDPLDGLTSTTSMTFNANRVLVYANGECNTVEIPDGVYTFKMEAGEGRFIIPYNA